METDFLAIRKLFVAILKQAKLDSKKPKYKKSVERFLKSDWAKLIKMYLQK